MVRQISSSHLGRYVALSVCVHLVSIAWVLRLLHVPAAPPPRPEPVRVMLVAPDLPAVPSPVLHRPATPAQSAASAVEEALIPPLPSPSAVASATMPEVVPLPQSTAIPPQKTTVHASLPRLDLPAKVPELEPTPRPQATPRARLDMQSTTPPASAPTASSPTTPAPPAPIESPAPIQPRQDAPRPFVPVVPTVGKLPELSPVTVSRNTPPAVATLPATELPVPLPAAAMLSKVATAAAPPLPRSSLPASTAPTTRRTMPAVAPVSVPAPSVAALSHVSSTPRTNPPSPSAPIVRTDVPHQPSAAPRAPAFASANPGQQAALPQAGSTPTMSPRFAAKPCPKYPYMARRRKSEGVAVVAFDVLANGHIDNVRVIQSSGDILLDHEAENTVKKWRPVPEAFASTPVTHFTVPFRFELEEFHHPRRSAPPASLDGERVICDGTSQHG